MIRKVGPFLEWRQLSACLLLVLSASICSRYLGGAYVGFWQVVLFVLSVPSAAIILKGNLRQRVGAVGLTLLVLFSVLLSASIVIGRHIIIANGNTYSGLSNENYLTPFGAQDIVAWVFISTLVFIYAGALHYSFHSRLENRQRTDEVWFEMGRIDTRLFVFGSLLILVLWTPFLFAFWPGFIFGDSISSITQAIGVTPLSNHHPVFYAMLIKCCLKVAALFGFGRTTGLAVLTVIQMALMAGSFAYSAAWAHARLRTPRIVSVATCVCIGFSPALGAFSVAMWKDPIFTAAFLVLSLNLGDLVISRYACVTRSSWIVSTFAVSLIAMLMRNNGMYVVILVVAVLVVVFVLNRVVNGLLSGRGLTRAFALLPFALSLASYAFVSGPVYTGLGVIPTESVEALGVPLNQMARVAAYGGDMSESDREYMDSMLALDQYDDVYTPCCTDMLKWNASFNSAPLTEDFMSHWLSMFVRNPVLYFESWVLQTYGFWTVNGPLIAEFDNIGGGVPRIGNRASEVHTYDIFPQNLTGSDSIVEALAWRSSPLPSGVLFWVFMFAMIELVSCRLRGFVLALLPSIGVIGTLVVASPVWYWPRYAMILNFMLPVLVCFLLSVCGIHVGKTSEAYE